MKPVAIRLSEDVLKKLDEVARRTLSSRSEVVRSALAVYFALIENLGFYFKPSLPVKTFDVFVERDAVNVDLGNMLSISVVNVSYAGVGEMGLDEKAELSLVAEVMASQLFVEAECRFVEPLVIAVVTGNDFDYSRRFCRTFASAVGKRMKAKVFLASCEEVFDTRQSFFAATLVGIRDMRFRNEPRRGDSIYLWGKLVRRDVRLEDLPSVEGVKRIVSLRKSGEASGVFPVKSDGVKAVASYAASLAGGRAEVEVDGSCPATAIIVTSDEDLSRYGCSKIGEIV
ncbi:MAG: CopG family transcriptional regulator [Archaeoglobaceae archaeon]